MKEWNNFFGSKLNSILLIVLIILMVFVIKIMLRNEAIYLPFLASDQINIQSTDLKPFEQIDKTKILGDKDDLISFSIWPNTKVHGVVSYRGVIQGGYFFEGNILINVLDTNKNVLKQSNAMATVDWMTAEPVSFEGNIDFSPLQKGPAYFEIHNDNPSDLRENDKSILIPIVIE